METLTAEVDSVLKGWKSQMEKEQVSLPTEESQHRDESEHGVAGAQESGGSYKIKGYRVKV